MNDQKKVRHLLGLSGGKDSAALAIYLKDKVPEMEYYFTDTGAELPETLEFIDLMEDYLGKEIIRLNGGRQFDYYLKLHNNYLPSAQQRWCTINLKLKPFEDFVGDDEVISYVGIRADEPQREGYISTKPNIKAVFPFKEDGLVKDDIIKLLEDSGLGLPKYYDWRSRSGCHFCFYQRKIEWIGLYENHPDLFEDAKTMFKKVIDEKLLQANAVVGIFPANSVNEDIELYDEDGKILMVLNQLRQQLDKKGNTPNFCLSDFIAPKDSGIQDYMGAFAVTAGINIDPLVEAYEADHDDYNSIMIKAVADRLAEAFAEMMHYKFRTQIWGYSDEDFNNDEFIEEKYRGIRPAPGYPACPEHSEKDKLWELLDVEKNTGMTLTSSYAMLPTASVSGWYFAHPESRYFGVAKINQEQVENYASRKGISVDQAERLLSPNLE